MASHERKVIFTAGERVEVDVDTWREGLFTGPGSDSSPFRTDDPSNPAIVRQTLEKWYITGDHCDVPVEDRVKHVGGSTYYFPLDFWPGVSGRPFRPCILKEDGVYEEVVNTPCWPFGMNSEATQSAIDRRLRKLGGRTAEIGVDTVVD
jgi:hypothetical protein